MSRIVAQHHISYAEPGDRVLTSAYTPRQKGEPIRTRAGYLGAGPGGEPMRVRTLADKGRGGDAARGGDPIHTPRELATAAGRTAKADDGNAPFWEILTWPRRQVAVTELSREAEGSASEAEGAWEASREE